MAARIARLLPRVRTTLREELLQDVLIRIWRTSVRSGSEPRDEVLLRQVVRWALCDHQRRQKRFADFVAWHQVADDLGFDAAQPRDPAVTMQILDGVWWCSLTQRQLRVLHAIAEGACGVHELSSRTGIREDEVLPTLRGILGRLGESLPVPRERRRSEG